MRSHVITTLCLVATASAVPFVGAGPPAAADRTVRVPTLSWSDCDDDLLCATAIVPLDHDRPDGRQIELAVAKLPATDAAHRIGTLFVNNGGPGNSVLDFMRGDVRDVLPDEVRARFDIVGFDPRGVGESTPIRCFADTAAQQEVFDDLPAVPSSTDEITIARRAARHLGRACRSRNGALLDHVGTADVARDLDLLRRAVGDRRLNFVGYSYGGLIGLTYAQLHPDLVRTMVVDGSPDPSAWFGDGPGGEPFSTRLDSHVAAADALDHLLERCQAAGPERCAFAAPDTRARFDTLLQALRGSPVTADLPPGPAGPGGPTEITASFLIDGLRGGLQFPPIWADLAGLLALTDAALTAPPAPPAGAAADGPPAGAGDESYDNSREALLSVACAETANPRAASRWPFFAARPDAEAAPFGADLAWLALPCATWPASATDPVRPDRHGAGSPVLVINTEHDAASTLAGARALVESRPGARLLTVGGAGHPASFIGNECVAATTSRYLVSAVLPAIGATCAAELDPFG